MNLFRAFLRANLTLLFLGLNTASDRVRGGYVINVSHVIEQCESTPAYHASCSKQYTRNDDTQLGLLCSSI